MAFERRGTFSRIEVQHLLIAWLALGLAFSIWYSYNINVPFTSALANPGLFIKILMISLLIIGTGFVGHELAHKFLAQRYGCLAEFRMWPLGLILALFIALISEGRFIFAAPGAVYITPVSFGLGFGITNRENGIISLSGPLTNVLLALIFFSLTFYKGLLYEIGLLGFFINLFLAAFNLIPFSPMDGYKVFIWNKGIWAIVAIPLWAIVIISIY